jgi:vesicle-associated membrane protein 72
MAALIYSFVARGTVVLAEYASPQAPGNYRHVAISCLERGVGSSSKFTFTADAHTFNFLLEGGYTYLVVATER